MAHDILIVDDEEDIRMMLAGILEDEGYDTRVAVDADSCFKAIDERTPAVVILDIWMQGSRLDGLQVLEELARDHPYLPVVMISGHGTIETAVSAIKQGAFDFIEKPFKADRLLLIIQRAIETAQLKLENAELRMRAGPETQMIGDSALIGHVAQTIAKVAPTGSRVLIFGPPGTGKEVVARMIHAHSPRAQNRLVVVNCAAMHPDRMEIELLGAEPGSGDGAESYRKIGLFEQADGGTLLLDEVADMPLETQGKIVRILQDQSFERVGGGRRIRVDVRVIASTNRDLAQEIALGRFREDLYYRLNVVPIRLPALRERREDITPLALHFMDRAASSAGLPPRPFGEDALAALQSYDWPGNVRQLRNVVDWLLIMAPGEAREPIRADMLPAEIGSVTPDSLRLDRSGEIMTLPLREAREMFERDYLIAQVTRFGGNVSKTAEFVGMERSALHRKLKSLGVGGSDRQKV
ncbi:sigma-54-dependent Fis family transcriptional regulator [Rhodospirillum rubrum]|uniref:nitrogen assimilation response regulator NtrX n=1 Tax=Rhodospirillum rubrum TaxID=1085 RepID=UPI001907A285|nr:sigma-54 dependent transcriptional regulator [Rhodospirillum rubrum]MBK1664748.1 sigma-54-dependent Fis family transcriptional regulator [Rhodospirillum rubrum]MBK1676408.1 sigma-54-dependent Fis family transcriptional regulator [Rhodospirillum rubrum]